MCFDADARSPIPAIAGASTDARDLVLTSADGTRFQADVTRVAARTGAGIVVLPDVRGLHAHYTELAVRLAEHGVDAVAIDFFARTAPTTDRGETFDFMAEVPKTHPHTLQADVAAAVAHLRSRMGGRVRSLSATALGYAGVLAFYGWPLGPARWPDRPKPIDAVSRFTGPVVSIYGGVDPGIPTSAIQAFDGALAKAGVPHETAIYDGAPHRFLDRRRTEFAEESADAWRRVQKFVRAYTG